jgi:methanogenic corrinoid protein MtbC1
MPSATVEVDAVREAFLAALVDHDAAGAERGVLAAVDDGLPVRDVYLGVLQPALYEVGRGWERGQLSVAQEHLATAVVQSLIAQLSDRLADRPGADRRPVRGRAVVACTPGELHAVGARFVADFLEGDGWEVLALGPSTPTASLLDLVEATRPAVVALSTTLASNLDSARRVLDGLDRLDPRPLIVAGGRAYDGQAALARALGADAFAGDAEMLRDLLRDRAPA